MLAVQSASLLLEIVGLYCDAATKRTLCLAGVPREFLRPLSLSSSFPLRRAWIDWKGTLAPPPKPMRRAIVSSFARRRVRTDETPVLSFL